MSREINRLVAEKVMGWPTIGPHEALYQYTKHGGYVCDGDTRSFPRNGFVPTLMWSPSTDIAAAWEIVEHFGSSYIQLDTGYREINGNQVGGWTCRIVAPGHEGEATASTVEMAICLAALRAVGVSDADIEKARTT